VSRADEPANPAVQQWDNRSGSIFTNTATGLTIREHFAGLAMQGILANPGRCVPGAADSMSAETFAGLMAAVALEFADALIAALAKDPQA
jgi:hypothetical protein